MKKRIADKYAAVGGLSHVVRFLEGVAHEDGCSCAGDESEHSDECLNCDCGRNLSIEQVKDAIRSSKARGGKRG